MSKDTDKALNEEITPENCGQKLDLVCQAAGISLTEFATLLSEKPATLSHIKSGRREPTQRFMDKLRALSLIRPKGQQQAAKDTSVLTALAIVVGVSSLARTKMLGSSASLAGALMGGAWRGLLTFGVLHALDVICKSQQLSYRETDNELEITKEADEGPQNP